MENETHEQSCAEFSVNKIPLVGTKDDNYNCVFEESEYYTSLPDHNKRTIKSDVFQKLKEYEKFYNLPELKIIGCNNNYKEKNPRDICRKIKEDIPSKSWLKSQRLYIESLPTIEKLIVSWYGTGHAVINLNGFLLGKIPAEKIEIPEYISLHYKDISTLKKLAEIEKTFNKVISEAPKLDKTIIVYRGEKKSHIPTKKGDIFEMKNFVSTTFDPFISYIYTNSFDQKEGKYGSLTKIHLKKGSRVLSVSPIAGDGYSESEIVLKSRSFFKVLNDQKKELFCIENIDVLGETKVFNIKDIIFNETELL